MSFFEFPYTRTYSSDLGWLIRHVKWLTDQVENKTIKYADPIEWNITSQYEMNTVVLDGTVAYLSKQAVPSGVGINNTSYWQPIFDIAPIIGDLSNLRDQISAHYETSYTATRDYNAGDWMFINDGTNDLLYYALTNILTNGGLVPDVTIKKATVEDLVLSCFAEIDRVDGNVGDLANLTTTDKTSIVNAINEVQGDTATNANNITTLSGNVGDLANLTTTDKTSIVNAINEIDGDIGDLANLQTVDKTSIVNAINETLDTAGKIIYVPSDTLGLDSTGVSDCASILSGLTENVGFKAGTYAIKSNCVINCDILFANNANLVIDPGISVTINGCIIAERRLIFSGDLANLTVDPAANPVGYPEWFGAVADNTTDSTAAIQTCINCFVKTSLTAGKYVISSTINLSSDKVLEGVEDTLHYTGENPNYIGSVFVVSNTFTGTSVINIDTCVGTCARRFIIEAGSEARSGLIGINVVNSIRTKLSDIFIHNTQRGIYATENITSYFERISGYTQSNSNINCFGMELYGQARGMSSLYILNCGWGFGGTDVTIGMYAHGYLNDLYVDHFEIAKGNVGMQINPDGPNIVTQGDIFFNNIVLDGQTDCCLRIQGINATNPEANIQIHNLWCGFIETNLSLHAVELINIRNVHIDGSEIYSNAKGILFNSAPRCNVTNTNVVNATPSIVSNSMAFDIKGSGLVKIIDCIVINFDGAVITDNSSSLGEYSINGITSRGILLNSGMVAYTTSVADIVDTTYNCIVRGPFKLV